MTLHGRIGKGVCERTEIAGENVGELEKRSADFEGASRIASGRTI